MELVWQSLLVYGLGICISLLVAVVIWGIDYLVARGSSQQAAALADPKPVPLPASPAAERVPPEHVAVIAAAVAAASAGPHRIIHIEDPARTRLWTAEGRMIHQTSHNIRRQGR